MSAAGSPGRPSLRADAVIIAVVVVMALGAIGYVLSQRQQALLSSPVGLQGLQLWLTSKGGSAQGFSGGWILDPKTVGLLVVPMHDTDPGQDMKPARSKEELLFQQDESDLNWPAIFDKIERAPVLIILPKWRSGMRLTGIAHPALLVSDAPVNAILHKLTGEPTIRMNRSAQVFTALPYQTADGTELTTEIYAAQLFDGTACDPIIGSGAQTLLAECPVRGSGARVLILSDPDLLNNHGLRLGQNADIAEDFLLSAAPEGRVILDYSSDNWFADKAEPIRRDRSWADLQRFFAPPFLTLWVGAGLMFALVLWRSLRRAEPVIAADGKDRGKLQAIHARARLMRLTGQDGAMLGDYAAARLSATAARLVGPGHARQIGEERAFLRHVARRRPELSERLAATLARLHALPPRISAAAAIHHVEDLEQILELIANDT